MPLISVYMTVQIRYTPKGCSRNYPWGGTFFFRPLHPQDTQGVGAPRPPGHVSALIKPPHYGSNMP